MSTLTATELFENLSSGALMIDTSGTIQAANPAMQALCSATSQQLVGTSYQTLLKLPAKTECALCAGQSNHNHRQTPSFHGGLLNTFQKEEIRVKVKHSVLPNEQILCLIEPFSEDTTLTQAHSDFVSTVSHEFRTPLTSIKGFADTLLQYGNQLPDDEKRRFITIIKDQADRLIRLVENLLTASRLGGSRLEVSYRPIPLQKLIEKVTHSVQAKVQTKQASIQRRFSIQVNPADLEVWADADRLEQILLNLVDNAVKYSASDSVVSIVGEFLPDDDSRIRIAVHDNGVGISEDVLPQIFTKFYRVESPLKQEVEGTGLGLYITQSLTQAMGGQLSVESTPGQGSTFTVIFPAATLERQALHRRRLASEDWDVEGLGA